MKPKSKKAKGNKFERDIAKSLREAGLDKQARRMPMSGAMEDLKADIITSLPIHPECKHHKTISKQMMGFYNQAKQGARIGKLPIAVVKENNGQPMAFLSWKDLLWIMQLASESGHFVQQGSYSKKAQLE